jgi:hypothetical protein
LFNFSDIRPAKTLGVYVFIGDLQSRLLHLTTNEGACNNKAEMTMAWYGCEGRNVVRAGRLLVLLEMAYVKIKSGLSSGWLSRC